MQGDGWEDARIEDGDQVRGYATDETPQLSLDTGDADYHRECPDCGAYIEEDADTLTVEDEYGDEVENVEGHDDDCGQKTWRAEESIGMYFNGAGVIVREDENRAEVQVWISVGDPRGAFCMTLELITNGDNAGELRLSVPTPTDGLLHCPLTALGSPGYYKVN